MKTIKTNAIITSIRAKVDGSIGFSGSTPEYTNTEKVAFMELQNLNIEMTLKPIDSKPTDEINIDKEIGEKTQSQRLRSVLFIYYQQTSFDRKDYPMDFNTFYRNKMEDLINFYKGKLHD